MLDVCLLGCGGMMPLPERRLTAAYLSYCGKSLLIDCGEGTQIALRENGLSFKKIDTILITHFHADHISGLPGLLLSIGNSERKEPLLIAGPKGTRRVVEALTVIAPELPFPIEYFEWDASQHALTRDKFHITAIELEHRVKCFGYCVSIERSGKFSPQKAAANHVPMALWNRLQKGEIVLAGGTTFTPDMVLGEARRGLKFAYTTDTRPVQAIVDAVQGADLFICEGIYAEEEKKEKAAEKKHMIFSEAAHLAASAKVKRLWLTHYSPALIRPEDDLEAATAVFPAAQAGFDGKKITLNFENE